MSQTTPPSISPAIWPCDNATYHADETRVSHSRLSVFADSPVTYEKRFISKTLPSPTSDAMALGSFVHSLALEGQKTFENFVIAPPCGKKSNADKQVHADHAAANVGKTILSVADWETGASMFDAMRKHPLANDLITAYGPNELSLVWDDRETGIGLKARLDAWRPEHQIIFDIKTCRDPSEQGFLKAITDRAYYRQAAFYIDGALQVLEAGVSKLQFLFIAVGSAPSHDVAVYDLSPFLLQRGEEENAALLQELSERLLLDDWSSRTASPEVVTVEAPPWFYKKEPFPRRVLDLKNV